MWQLRPRYALSQACSSHDLLPAPVNWDVNVDTPIPPVFTNIHEYLTHVTTFPRKNALAMTLLEKGISEQSFVLFSAIFSVSNKEKATVDTIIGFGQATPGTDKVGQRCSSM